MLSQLIKKSITPFEQSVYAAVRRIPRGKVATYAAIARAIEMPGAARAVGNALNKNPFAPHVPCHRVVRSDMRAGGFARGGTAKERLLRKEGVRILRGSISPEFILKFLRI